MNLTDTDKTAIAKAYFNGHQKPEDIAKRYGVRKKTILNVLKGGNPEEYIPPYDQIETYESHVTLYGCPMCGKLYGIRSKSSYVYKAKYKHKIYYFCGYDCHKAFADKARELKGEIYDIERRKDL